MKTVQLFLILVCAAVLWALPPVLYAQGPQYPYTVDTKPSRGIMPNSEQLSGPFDHIDPVSGKLHLQIPLASLPPGNAGSGFDLALTYDSHLYDLYPQPLGPQNAGQLLLSASSGGWNYNHKNYKVEVETRFIPNWDGTCNTASTGLIDAELNRVYRYRLTLPDGSQHLLHLFGYGDDREGYYNDGFYAIDMAGNRSRCARESVRYPQDVRGILTWFSSDGSYLRFQIQADGTDWFRKTWTLFYPDGRRVEGVGDEARHLYDANGNGVHISKTTEAGHTVDYITDDFARSIRLEYNANVSGNESEDRITISGPSGPLEWRVRWQAGQVGVPGSTTFICYEDTSRQPPLTGSCPFSFVHKVVKAVMLPLAAPTFIPPPGGDPWTRFEFSYTTPGAGYGRLVSMRLPSGALYSYCCDTYSAASHAEGIVYAGYSQRTMTHDGTSESWTYSKAGNTSRVRAPDGGETIYHFYDPQIASLSWTRDLIYWIEEPDGTVRKRQWTRNKVPGLSSSISVDANNPFVERESVTWDAVAGQTRTALTDTLIDKNGNVLSLKEYGWSTTLSGALLESPGPLLRETQNAYYTNAPSAADVSNGANRYWNPSASSRLNALSRTTVRDGAGTIAAVTESRYDDPFSRGNLTEQRSWDDARSGCQALSPLPLACPVKTRVYNAGGNLTDVFEPEIRTHVTYAGPYPSRVDYAPGAPVARGYSYSWNLNTGLPQSSTDIQMGLVTTFGYDAYGRQTLVDEGGLQQTKTEFNDADRKVRVRRDAAQPGDGTLQSVTEVDQLGRVVLVRNSEGLPLSWSGEDGIKVRTTYRTFVGGTETVTSTPYRTTSDETLEWLCKRHDQGGRVVAVATFKGSAAPGDCEASANRTGVARTEYHAAAGAPRVRFVDPAGVTSARYTDPLGRLSSVVEDPDNAAYTTSYSYDVLNDLTSVLQSSAEATQQRLFTYTSLGRLKSALHPETGTLRYTYYDSGDLLSRTDNRGVVTSWSYDELHRLKTRTYANDGGATPPVTVSYHRAGPCVGQLDTISAGTGSALVSRSLTSCDGLGRVLRQVDEIPGAGTLSLNYGYWANGSLRTLEYPSGRLVGFSLDSSGRTTQVSTTDRIYADLTNNPSAYTADGRLAQMHLGNGLWETRHYRTPDQPTVLALGNTAGAADQVELQYRYSPTVNNGNLRSHTIIRGQTAWAQAYAYDGLNRLTCASESLGAVAPGVCDGSGNSWTQRYSYDRFGNRWTSGSSGFGSVDVHEPTAEGLVNKWTNRLAGLPYDAAGNLELYTPWTLKWDGENRLVEMNSAADGRSTFTYDAEGRRIKKVTTIPSPSTTYYLYDLAGRLVSELSSTASAPGTTYMFTDLLGTPRALTTETGAIAECPDYTPFGKLLTTATRSLACHQPPTRTALQFTGHIRDRVTDLDDFGARFFSNAQGRFLSPDSPRADQHPEDPQSWNLYAYVRNNPLRFVDPTGRQARKAGGPKWESLPDTDNDRPRSVNVLIGALKGAALGLIGAGRALGMDEPTADSMEAAVGYSTLREESVGKLLQTYQTAVGVKAAASGVGAIAKGGSQAARVAEEAATSIRFGPHVEGPLPDDIAATFRGGSYSERILTSPTIMWRVTSEGGDRAGRYWTTVEPKGPLQAIIDLALFPKWGNRATRVVSAEIPAGTKVFQGFVAPQRWLFGGGVQVFIQEVSKEWLR